MRKMLKVFTTLLLLSSALSAGGKGFYVGAGLAGEYVSDYINEADPNEENRLVGLMLRAGYGIDYLSVELRSSKTWAIEDSLSKTNAIGIFLKPNIDLTKKINVYGLAGFGNHNVSFSDKEKLFYGYTDNDVSQNSFSFGGGVEYAYNDHIGFFGEVVQVIDEESAKRANEIEVDTFGIYVGVNYYFRKEEIIEAKPLDIAVLFDTDESVIKSEYFEQLDRYAEFLEEKSDMTLTVTGHTDSVGEENYNQVLSQKRAESIKTYLMDKGIDASRITAVGRGEETPRSSNDTTDGRHSNRRIEATLLQID